MKMKSALRERFYTPRFRRRPAEPARASANSVASADSSSARKFSRNTAISSSWASAFVSMGVVGVTCARQTNERVHPGRETSARPRREFERAFEEHGRFLTQAAISSETRCRNNASLRSKCQVRARPLCELRFLRDLVHRYVVEVSGRKEAPCCQDKRSAPCELR